MVKATEGTTPGQELGGKLSAAVLGFEKATILEMVMKDKDAEHFLFRVMGQATDIQEYTSNFANKEQETGYGLLGMFEATTRDGNVVDGTTLYLPAIAQNMAVAAVKGGNNVTLALDIYAKYDADAATSYIFVVRTLIEPDRTAINELKKAIGNTPMPRLT